MVLVALFIRLAVVAFLYPDQLNPDRDHWVFAYETGRVARSIATGHGFANPQYDPTGPTALMPPVFPYILAGVFKIFGVYTTASAIAILSLQSLFSAFTCIPVFFLARRSFGRRAALWAGWGWAFFPYAIYFAADWVWSTCLTTLLLTILFLITLKLKHSTKLVAWAGFGLLYGFAALTDPVVLSVLPFLFGWACFHLYQERKHWLLPAAVAGLMMFAVISPWFIRNYRTFHTVIPFRSGMGLELYTGNNGYDTHWVNRDRFPAHNTAEMQEYKQLGEIAYMAKKRDQALQYIATHPKFFLWISVRRVVYIWTGFWSFGKEYLVEEPLDPINVIICTGLSILTLLGLRKAFRNDFSGAILYSAVLLIFPAVYFLTHPEVYYRRPIDPLFVILAAYLLVPVAKPGVRVVIEEEAAEVRGITVEIER